MAKKVRYFSKLKFDKGLKTLPDPYKVADEKWSRDLTDFCEIVVLCVVKFIFGYGSFRDMYVSHPTDEDILP